MILVEEHDRNILSEGKNYGMGFAFCKKNDDVYTTTHAITACKDFLNDQVWSDKTGEDYYIYGLKTKPMDLFLEEYSYMAISILKYQRTLCEYQGYKDDVKKLNEGYKTLESFINQIETKLKIKNLSKINRVEDNKFLVSFPSFWADNTYLISLYTLLLRSGLNYKNGEDVFEFLTSRRVPACDAIYLENAVTKLKKMIEGYIPVQDMKELRSPHSMGIVNFKF